MMRYMAMNKFGRIILKTFSVCMAMVLVAVNVSAAGLTFSQNPDDSMVISGTAGASLKRQTVTAYITRNNDTSITVMSKNTNPDGSFEFDWIPSTSGKYTVEVRAGTTFLTDTYWYSSVTEYNEILNIMKTGNADAVKGVLTDSNKLSVIHLEYDDIKNYDSISLAKAICTLRDYSNGAERVLELIDDAKIISQYLLSKTPEELVNTRTILADYGINLTNYQFFTEITDAQLKSFIAESFVSRISESLSNADEAFTDSIVLTAVEKCSSWSLLDSYLNLLPAYSGLGAEAKDKAAYEVVGKTYSSRELLIQAINNANGTQNPAPGPGASPGGDNTSPGGDNSGANSYDDGESVVSIPAQLPSEITKENDGEKVVFSDVTESHWAFEAINYLRWEGVVMGSDFNNYYPENTVTRAEMTAMLARAYKISGGKSSFTDVSEGQWYYAPISAAFSRGLVSGDGEAFHPNDYVTRQDMAAMIYRFSKDAGREFAAGELTFPDSHTISDYAKEPVAALSAAGIIRGVDGGFFAPMQNATRAQAAQLIYSALRYK